MAYTCRVASRDVRVDVHRIITIAIAAGREIMEVASDPEANWGATRKADDSPLTLADLRANKVICDALRVDFPAVPIVSEEEDSPPWEERREYSHFWCVDPLDGTKEFIKRNGQFTVNIALCEVGAFGTTAPTAAPVLGVVHTPATGVTHWAIKGLGAFRRESESAADVPIAVAEFAIDDPGLVVVASRSHLSPETEAFIATLNAPTTESVGSSLKLLMVAEGKAHLYPRFAPTCEWDTAASHIIVDEAGGSVTQVGTGPAKEGRRMEYNKEDKLNPFFLCEGRRTGGAAP